MSLLKKTTKDLINNKLARNVMLLASGTAGAQVLGVIMMPFITRMYGPESFGVLGAFTAIVTAIAPVAALTYPVAIVLAKTDEESLNISGVSILIGIISALLVFVSLLLFDENIISMLKLDEVGLYIYILPVAMISSVLTQVVRQWFIRNKLYNKIARVSILQALITNGSMLIVGFLYPFSVVLIIIYSINIILQAILLLGSELWSFLKRSLNLTFEEMRVISKKYNDFPLYRAPQVAINAFSASLPVLFLTAFFGTTTAGYYALTRIALGLPAGLIGQSVTEVFYPRFVEADERGENKQKILFKALLVLIGLGLIPYLTVIIIGPWLFSFVFGDEWVVAGKFAQWMSVWLFSTLITRPIIAAIPVLKVQGLFLVFEVCALIIRGISIFSGYYFYDDELYSIAFLAIANFLLYTFLCLVVYIKSSEDNKKKAL